jgi:hypothetical protein
MGGIAVQGRGVSDDRVVGNSAIEGIPPFRKD